MDMFERLNSRFGKWYEGLFGAGGGDLRPGDVLRKIQDAMEDNRVTHFDGKVYVPNKYVLNLAVENREEYDYLLTFVDAQELVPILRSFMKKHSYETKGGLDITINRLPEGDPAGHEKLQVVARFDKDIPSEFPQRSSIVYDETDPQTIAGDSSDEEDLTIPAVGWATLAMTLTDGRKTLYTLNKPTIQIGRSHAAGNDLVLDGDGQVSKSHARLERESDGRWTLFDLGSTNGVKVGTISVTGNRTLRDGDIITIGATVLLFHENQTVESEGVEATVAIIKRACLQTSDGIAHLLASETLIGRAITSDIVLSDPTVSSRHARVVSPDTSTYWIEDLGSTQGTFLNDATVTAGQRMTIKDGDVLRLGESKLRFVAGSSR